MTEKLIRISTDAASYVYDVQTETEAFKAFAVEAGYKDYADLSTVLGMSVEQAKKQCVVEFVTLREALFEIIDEALESDIKKDGAENPFRSADDWARWCMDGATGDQTKAFAKGAGIDLDDARRTVENALRERDLDDINDPFAEVIDEAELQEAFSEVEAGLNGVTEDIRDSWVKEDVAFDAKQYVDAYIFDDEHLAEKWSLIAFDGSEFRTRLDKMTEEYLLNAIAERDEG